MLSSANKLASEVAKTLEERLKRIDEEYKFAPKGERARRPFFELKGVACIPCTKNHLSTIAGALGEAVRFARSEGVSSEEVRRRIGIVEDELNIWERVDATPDKLEALEPHEREVMREALRRGRELRHYLEESGLSFGKGSVDCVEKAYVMAADIRDYFKRELSGVSEMSEKREEKTLETPLAQKAQEAVGVKELPPTLTECPPCDLDAIVDLAIQGIKRKGLSDEQASVEYAAVKSRACKLKVLLDEQLKKLGEKYGADKVVEVLQELFDKGTYTIDDVENKLKEKFG